MPTHANGGPSLPDPRDLLRIPGALLGGLTSAGTQLARETSAVLAAIRALPRLVVALERLASMADSLDRFTQTRAALDELANNTRHVPPALGQLRALHEQVVEIACDLRVLEPEIERLASSTASLDQSIRVLARAFAPLQAKPERDDRRVNRVPERRHRNRARPD
jgi:chromosome segregation ATPase